MFEGKFPGNAAEVKSFQEQAIDWQAFVDKHFGNGVATDSKRTAVLTLLEKGIVDMEALAYITDAELAMWLVPEGARVVLQRSKSIALAALETAERERIRQMAEEHRVTSHDDTIMSGEVVADSLEPQAIAELETALQCRLLEVGLEDFGKKLTPKQSLDLLKGK